jgi:hypothetical protein
MLRHKLTSRGKKEPPMLSAMQVKRALRKGDQVMMVQLSELKLDSQMPANQKLADLLKEYEDVFYLVSCLLSGMWATPFQWNRVPRLRFGQCTG